MVCHSETDKLEASGPGEYSCFLTLKCDLYSQYADTQLQYYLSSALDTVKNRLQKHGTSLNAKAACKRAMQSKLLQVQLRNKSHLHADKNR